MSDKDTGDQAVTPSTDEDNTDDSSMTDDSTSDTLMTVEEILAAFESTEDVYQRAAVDAAIAQREEVVPHLIELLERVAASPEEFHDSDSPALTYVLFLLAHLEETDAHSALIKAFSLSDKHLWRIMGDITTEYLPTMFLKTSGGSLEQIKAVARDTSINKFVRSSAMRALNFAVVTGVEAREDAIEFYRSLLEDRERNEPDAEIWSSIGADADELYPEELMPIFEEIEREDLFDSMVYSLDAAQKTIEDGKETTLARTSREEASYSLDDIHDVLPLWVTYGEAVFPIDEETKQQLETEAKLRQKKKSKKKKKRKMAKKSRKKNRR